jgi:hypothetical protein
LAADVSSGGSDRRIGNFYQKSLLSVRSVNSCRQRNKAVWCFKVLILGWSLEIVQPTIGESKKIGIRSKENRSYNSKKKKLRTNTRLKSPVEKMKVINILI